MLPPAGCNNDADRRSPQQDTDETRQCTNRDTHKPPPRPLTASHEYAQVPDAEQRRGSGQPGSPPVPRSPGRASGPPANPVAAARRRSPRRPADAETRQRQAERPGAWSPRARSRPPREGVPAVTLGTRWHRHTRTNAATPARPSNHLIQRPGKYGPSAPPAPACTQAFPQVSSHFRTLDSTLGCGTQVVESTDSAATSCHAQRFLRAGTPSRQLIKDPSPAAPPHYPTPPTSPPADRLHHEATGQVPCAVDKHETYPRARRGLRAAHRAAGCGG
ncbi:hypothetical protein SAMN02787118_110180 [Streptomyces mirabilis]|uniref:Uncharacterized protein n=1 Tax=Streptomyces mirabilis TaxID=68239 RepID=A0A1I2KJC1_9ACTN|nr:hypothetical protein SAMN02787118_110180 [Streptomyces mirabilis]